MLLVGVGLTALALLGMVVWSLHEIGRVDDVIAEVDARRDGDEGGAAPRLGGSARHGPEAGAGDPERGPEAGAGDAERCSTEGSGR